MFKIEVCRVAQEVRSIHISIRIDWGSINQDLEFDRSSIDVQSIEIKYLRVTQLILNWSRVVDSNDGQNGLLPFSGKLISLLPFFPN